MSKFVMKSAGPPIGQYTAKFLGCTQSVHEEYGPRVLFEWEILEGKETGTVAMRYTSAKTSPKSALSKIAAGLAGRKFEPGEEFDSDQFVGETYLIVVAETDSGSTRVETVLKP